MGKITAVANNNLLNILQQAEGAVGAVGTAATAIMSSPVGMAAGIVIVTGAAVMFVDQHYLDGAIGNKLADGVDFVADKTKEAASWVGGKAKEAGTWISDKVKSAWDNISLAKKNHEDQTYRKIKNEVEGTLGRKLTKKEQKAWEQSMGWYKQNHATNDEHNPSLTEDELRQAAEDALGIQLDD